MVPILCSILRFSPFKLFKQVYFTCVPCYLVGIEKQYSGITYTQSHGQKCVNCPTFINWLSKHTELHDLIPQCIEIEEFECAGTSLLPAEEDESFSMSHLHHLQASFKSKVMLTLLPHHHLLFQFLPLVLWLLLLHHLQLTQWKNRHLFVVEVVILHYLLRHKQQQTNKINMIST